VGKVVYKVIILITTLLLNILELKVVFKLYKNRILYKFLNLYLDLYLSRNTTILDSL
jgi:hypothetical protein